MYYISKFILYLFGWKVTGHVPPEIKKAIILDVPHTSTYDFFIGRFAFYVLGIDIRLLIKKEAFRWPFGGLLKRVGGIPIDRTGHTNKTKAVVALFEEHDSLFVGIAPEGTRKLVKRWKRGFYFIALEAKIPIFLGYMDYKKKEGGLGSIFYPTGDYEKDLAEIEAYYRNVHARHPERFNLSAPKELLDQL